MAMNVVNLITYQMVHTVQGPQVQPPGTYADGEPFIFLVRNCKLDLGDNVRPGIRSMMVVAESLGEPFDGTVSFDERLGPIINGLDKLVFVFRPPFYPDQHLFLSLHGHVIDSWQEWITQIVAYLGKHLREEAMVEVDNGRCNECLSLKYILDEHFKSGYEYTPRCQENRAVLSLSWDYHPDDFQAGDDSSPSQ